VVESVFDLASACPMAPRSTKRSKWTRRKIMSVTRATALATIHPTMRTTRKTRIFGSARNTESSRFWKLWLTLTEASG
jgi:hypothetical protein